MDYIPSEIEKKWQKTWDKNKTFKASEEPSGKKYYCLEMFPYPSGKLHMGHVRNYSIGDIISRYKRMRGYNVLHPIGWDSFGLPAENAAIKHGVHPAGWTWKNIEEMRRQLKTLGLSYDWDREIATCHPDYYRWEQLFFIKMFDKGLVYKKSSTVNWCADCNTVLANEQVVDGKCWRCSNVVTSKELEQWFFRITEYAQELLDGCEKLTGWPERVTTMQKNWIGRSTGVEVRFPVDGTKDGFIEIYTTRPDTIFGVTFMSIAPEHPMVRELCKGKKQEKEVLEFVQRMRRTSKIERTAEGGVKEGVFTGAYAINPLNNEKVPVYVANFVLLDYGTGAVMAVPAHDTRDFDFAKKYSIPVKRVIYKDSPDEPLEQAYTEPGTMINSGNFNNMNSDNAIDAISDFIESNALGKKTVNYRLKDWGISRQRYWGCPIPVIYCDKCGIVTVPEEKLPVLLPEDARLEVIGDNPLSKIESFVNTKCHKCGGNAKRETETMDTFVESSWYYARYACPDDNVNGLDKKRTDYWLPVDQYIGGIEHAVMHLLYVRFFHKVLRDLGYLSGNEPAQNLLTQGMVVKDGFKMSKSKGNTVDPDYIIDRYGSDTARLFSLFAAPPERDLDWNDKGVEGCYRFLSRVWRFVDANRDILNKKYPPVKGNEHKLRDLRSLAYKTLEKVTADIEVFHFNTAVAAMMELTNEIYRVETASLGDTEKAVLCEVTELLMLMLAPYSPHICSELWELLEKGRDISCALWPEVIREAIIEDTVTVVVQVNGKLRSKLVVGIDTDEQAIRELAFNDANVRKFTANSQVKKVIYVKNRLLNIVV
ncbi:MAG: leucine--tRNA ligase [Oligoflexia bacterium]|nr:leucine--tRNA ligase [Oligoflexia bacterium]